MQHGQTELHGQVPAKIILDASWPPDDGTLVRPWLDTLITSAKTWAQMHPNPGRIGLFWASEIDSLAADRAFELSRQPGDGRYASPNAFRHTLANMDPAVMALALGLTGPVMTFSVRSASPVAGQSARRWLAAGRIDAAVVVAEQLIEMRPDETWPGEMGPCEMRPAGRQSPEARRKYTLRIHAEWLLPTCAE